jgi:hypothetical protein
MTEKNEQALKKWDSSREITPVMDIKGALIRLQEFKVFIDKYLIEGEDYGIIPGTKQPSLWKPGADKLCEVYKLADDYVILNREVDYEKGLFDYEIKCILTRDGCLVASGLGSCCSWEAKYRYRDGKRKCPACGEETIIPSKPEYGGGFYCYPKNGGCGARFDIEDPEIVDQKVGKVENDDLPAVKNTVLKQGKKRSKIDAVLAATRSSSLFTQDLSEDDDIKDAASKAKPAGSGTTQKPAGSGTTQKRPPAAGSGQGPKYQDPRRTDAPPPQNTVELIKEVDIQTLWHVGMNPNEKRGALVRDQVEKIIISFGYWSMESIRASDYKKIYEAIEQGKPNQNGRR